MASVTPKYVWSEGFKPTKTRNLFPATYERDPAIVRNMLERAEASAAAERRMLHRALKAGDKIVAKSARKGLDRFNEHARNCRQRLAMLSARPARPLRPVLVIEPGRAAEAA